MWDHPPSLHSSLWAQFLSGDPQGKKRKNSLTPIFRAEDLFQPLMRSFIPYYFVGMDPKGAGRGAPPMLTFIGRFTTHGMKRAGHSCRTCADKTPKSDINPQWLPLRTSSAKCSKQKWNATLAPRAVFPPFELAVNCQSLKGGEAFCQRRPPGSYQ